MRNRKGRLNTFRTVSVMKNGKISAAIEQARRGQVSRQRIAVPVLYLSPIVLIGSAFEK